MPGTGMKHRRMGYGGSAAKPKRKKMAMGGTAKKVTPMKHGGGHKKPGLYMMEKGGAMKKATKKQALAYAMGGKNDKLKGVKAMAASLGMKLVPNK